MKDSILVQAWAIYKNEEDYYIENVHSIYLESIKLQYVNIYLVCPTRIIYKEDIENYHKLDFENVKIYELPYFSSYANSYKNFFSYLVLYNSIKHINFNTIYSRFPSPFGWLQMFYFKNNRIVHFVGDPIDTVLNNKEVPFLYRLIKMAFFIPEYLMFIISSYKADKVFSNGHHIAKKVSKYGISIKPLISSTLNKSDFYEEKSILSLNDKPIRLIYVGYLRRAKGINILIDAIEILESKFPGMFTLTIVGDGEEGDKLSKRVVGSNLPVSFLGRIDNREKLNNILRSHDVFCFASISEGSPRVVLEAIANGLIVVTTPVGSLPYIFEDNTDILFFEFDNPTDLVNKIIILCEDKKLQIKLKENSFDKVKKFKIDSFIREAFNA